MVGVSEFGLAGLTAVDYLVERLGLEKTGCVTTDNLPSITPFEGGRPRHHTRFFSSEDADFTVLAGELFIPLGAARSFGDAIIDWTERSGVDVDTGPLEEYARELQEQYKALAERMSKVEEESRRRAGEDRAYM